MDRIQKILAHGGIASRRAAEELIKNGRVRVNGHVVTELGAKADARRDRIEVDGKRVVAEDHVYIVLNKPRGVVSTMSDPEGRPTVKELLTSLGARVYPVGRLDFATSGVLLATNDGELADGLLHPRKTVPKTYVLKVKGVMKPADLEVWRKGVRLEDGMTLPADANLIRHEGDKTWLELTIKEGRNQQIRRMGDATGFPVMRLSRVAFAEVSGEGLAPGRWRHLTRDELVQLKKTYGVPRSIPADTPRTETAARPQHQRGGPAVRRGATGRTQRAFGRNKGDETTTSTSTSPTSTTQSPRYGGGSPGRRGYDVTEDWGGGAQRGSTRGHERSTDQARPSSSVSGGRGGRTRTTAGADQPRSDGRTRTTAGADQPRSDVGGGRGGRTRTTGTSGGIGSTSDAPRVKGRRSR